MREQYQVPVIFVVGATASGKSALAMDLAQATGGVIFNCDSVQAYAKVHIGAAKPSAEDMRLVPHYLYSYVLPPREITAGDYRRDFVSALETVPASKPVFVTGGTGFYFQAIERGMFPLPPVSEEVSSQVRLEFRKEGGREKLYAELQRQDPEEAARIHINDSYRLCRAIEILRTSHQKPSEWRKKFSPQKPPFRLLKLGVRLPIEELERRISLRAEGMLKRGLVEETKQLLDEGLGEWAPLRSVGYKEVQDYLRGKSCLEALKEQIVLHTRQLAKRQITWFQRDKEIFWLHPESEKKEALSRVRGWLISLP
ncbi:MAG: tRNA (adenosine(37)-N6)-dimethylallyltransferase MiaA [Bdellovibrionaceae bacterium]|nr:tRNA (adenosine(37)-N6)-dimethylallyltransferase MiaA [Pseudobdellovibrionaceae bacterium]